MTAGRFLVTQSLLSSWNYLFNCWEGKEDEAMEGFLQTLRREPTMPTDAMLNGIEFEREVYNELAGAQRTPHRQWEAGILAVATALGGAQIQVVPPSVVINLGGKSFVLYGKLDALKAGVIFDIKFSDSYEVGKYIGSPQHPAYFTLVPEAREFRYLISDGEDMFTESYLRHQTRDIREIVAEFIESIRSMGLLPLYEEKWLAL